MLYRVLVVTGLCAGLALAGLSGTYTVKPQGGGDFTYLWEVNAALMDSGLSGDCVFLLDSGDYSGREGIWQENLNDSFLLTFRAAPGQHAVISSRDWGFRGNVQRLELDGLEFGPLTFLSYGPDHSGGSSIHVHDCTIRAKLTLGEYTSYAVIERNRIAYLHLDHTGDVVVANNAFMQAEANWLWGALAVEGPEAGVRVLYNTFYRPSGIEELSSCWAWGYGLDFRNNVLAVLDDSAYGALAVETAYCSFAALDHNCYWTVPSVPSVYDFGTGDEYTLPEWQAVGWDLSSRYADPMVTSAADPHLLAGSPCIGAGTPITGFYTDIDGDPRDPVHPCIGCDEYRLGGVESERDSRRASAMLTIVPNPAGAVARVTAPAGETAVAVYDAIGRRVRVLGLTEGRASLGGLAPGAYIVRGARTGASARLVVR
jgi:hypothetical protein